VVNSKIISEYYLESFQDSVEREKTQMEEEAQLFFLSYEDKDKMAIMATICRQKKNAQRTAEICLQVFEE
jgi:hypothetical protein